MFGSSTYAEAAFFDGIPCAHIAAYEASRVQVRRKAQARAAMGGR